MTKEQEEAMLCAWQKYHYGESSELERADHIKPSKDFAKGFDAAIWWLKDCFIKSILAPCRTNQISDELASITQQEILTDENTRL